MNYALEEGWADKVGHKFADIGRKYPKIGSFNLVVIQTVLTLPILVAVIFLSKKKNVE